MGRRRAPLAMGLLLACVAFIVAVETKSLLIGESADGRGSSKIVAELEAGPRASGSIHLRTPTSARRSCSSRPRSRSPARRPRRTWPRHRRGRGRIREVLPIAETIYLEPDIYHPDEVDATDPSVQVVRRSRSRLRRGPRRSA